MRFTDYASSASVPNVVVDGAPNDGTVLTLTHWPGIAQPSGLEVDLSAQMAFRFVREGREVDADVVTNDHFDQDGLVAMFALIEPETALAHEELLVDVAAAGDFGTFRHRAAARATMALAAYTDPDHSPIADSLDGPYQQICATLYRHTLDLVVPMVVEPEHFEGLWAEDDAALTASEAALRDGRAEIVENADLDLAVLTVDDGFEPVTGRRFCHETHTGLHPMATNNATGCLRVLEIRGRRFQYVDRYETWVQYRSRRPLPRVDLRPLAERLNGLDPAGGWTATAPRVLVPRLVSAGDSGLAGDAVVEIVGEYLATAPPAWDPYR